jgi:hypothetical protein
VSLFPSYLGFSNLGLELGFHFCVKKAILVHFVPVLGFYHVGFWILFVCQEFDYVGL